MNNWIELHNASQKRATDADASKRAGDAKAAVLLYGVAAELEEQALSALDLRANRTRAVTGVSAAALWYKAGVLDRAEQLAYKLLLDESLAPFVQADLKNLLLAIWGS